MKLGLGLSLSYLNVIKSGIIPPVGALAISGVTLNPFSATVTPPTGYAIVSGAASINIPAKPGSYGTAQTVAATVTGGLSGSVTETTAGSVVAALILAGWINGETPKISVSVDAVPYALPAGVAVLYDTSFVSSLYLDIAGTTPVTAAGQSVGRISDISGNGYHATQANSGLQPKYLATPSRALFDGFDDYLATSVVPSASGTIAARFFVPSAAVGRTLIGAANADGKQILLYVSTAGYISAYGTGATVIASAVGPIAGAWHTAAMSWSNTSLSLYLDGGLVGSASQVSPVLVTYPFFIGARNAAGTANSLTNGSIGAAAIYDRVLNAAEHLQLHNAWSSIA